MPLPAAAVNWKAVKWLLKESAYALPSGLAYLNGLLSDDASVTDVGWMRVHVKWARSTPAGTSEDFAQFKLDIVNITSGAIDTTWTAGDFTAIGAALDTFTTTLKGNMTSNHTLAEYRAYRMSFDPTDPGPIDNPKTPGHPFKNSGPPVWVAPKSGAGTGGVIYPYQVAVTCTFKTAWPHHWGRVYIPGLGAVLDSNGRISSATRKFYADAFFDLADDLGGAGFVLAVPVAQVSKAPFHALLGVEQFVVDDIPDVQRRRRPKTVAARTIGVE